MPNDNPNPTTTTTTTTPAALPVETQAERRLKYGLNVLVATVIAVLLGGLVTWAAERKPKRVDTTASGLYSLKPQTINLIQNNPQKVKITSLYTKAKAGADVTRDGDSPIANVADQAEKVADLLEEYKTKGKNIEVDEIDPVASPAKVEDLINEVSEKYGGEIAKYRKFAETYPEKFKKITDLAEAEVKQLQPLATDKSASEGVLDFVDQVTRSIRDLPKKLTVSDATVQKALKQKPPNYKGVTDSVMDNVSVVSSVFGQVIDQFKKLKDDKTVPESLRKYMTDSLPRYEAMKKASDDLIGEVSNLGELKLDTLRDALRQKNPILIRGEKEWKVLSYDQVWRADNRDVRALRQEGAQIRPRFAGEQMITTAILALQNPKKQKVVFIRAGGAPLSQPGFPPFQPSGPFSSIAERLREYNFEVLDKDVTGMWAMQQQQQQQQMPSAPEPSDADIKDAIWVIFNTPSEQSQQFGAAPTVAPKVHEHLMNGGSAMVVTSARADDLSMALSSFGVQTDTQALCVHELINTAGAQQGDVVEEAQKVPVIFAIRDWGNHVITNTMQSLGGILIQAVPVKAIGGKGVTVTPLIPIPTTPPSWGEKDLASLESDKPTYDKDKDIPAPLFAGAAIEKTGTPQRLVVVGSPSLFAGAANVDPRQTIVDFPDLDLLKRGIRAARFPGNAELFMNSMFWLSHQEPMIAISPAAMDVSRLGEMSKGTQRFWRVGVLLVGLPGLVILAGAMVYFARRD